jgi:phage-related tail fiber protein
MTVFNPIITQQGQAAVFNAQATGTQLALTHMAYGTGAYNPTGTETALKAEVKRVPIGGGARITENQIRIASIWASSADKVNITEIGFYAGTVLFAVISRAAGGPYMYKTPGSNLIFSYDWVINLVPIGSISISVDPDALALLVHMADANAHPQYLTIAEYQQRDSKNSVRVATTANIPSLSGLLTVDEVALVEGDRVLVKNQAKAFQNGIYIVAAGAWYRAPDADASAKMTSAMMASVEQGTANFDSLWQLTTNAPIVLGATNLVFEVVSGPSGVEAGSYTKVTVDSRGRVTVGSNPTTLAGYGVTDAYTKAQTLAGFTKQGGGVGMLSNAVLLGWNGSNLMAQVDLYQLGNLWYSGNFNPAEKQARLELVSTISAFPLTYAPAGWLKANGAAVSRIAYADLFARIGTTFGAGDGVTTFNLPDYRGEFLRGFDDGRGLDVGRTINTIQAPMQLSHTHTASTDVQGYHGHTGVTYAAGDHTHYSSAASGGSVTVNYGSQINVAPTGNTITGNAGGHQHSLAIDGNGSHAHNVAVSTVGGAENRPRNIAVLYCIKY